MLKFLRNDFGIVVVQKIRKKGLSHSGKMHFSVSGHVTLGVVRWRHQLDYICPLWVLSKFGPIEAYMCRVIASWFFPSNGIKRYFNGPLSKKAQHVGSTNRAQSWRTQLPPTPNAFAKVYSFSWRETTKCLKQSDMHGHKTCCVCVA